MTFHKTMFGFTIILILSGCASKFAPVVSRPDNLIIECESTCKFNIPMNTEIMVARNTNGYDMGKELIRQIPFIGALALSWKSMDVAENLGEMAIDSFNRGANNGASTTTSTVTTNTTTTGDTISSEVGDTITRSGDSDSGNSTSGDMATSGDTIGGDSAGGDIDKSVVTEDNDLDYSNRSVTYPQSP